MCSERNILTIAIACERLNTCWTTDMFSLATCADARDMNRSNSMSKIHTFTKHAGKAKKHIPEDVTFDVDNVAENHAEALAWNEGGEIGVYNNWFAHVEVMANAAFMGVYKAARNGTKERPSVSHEQAVEAARTAMLKWKPSLGDRVRVGKLAKGIKHAATMTQDERNKLILALGGVVPGNGSDVSSAPKGKLRKSA